MFKQTIIILFLFLCFELVEANEPADTQQKIVNLLKNAAAEAKNPQAARAKAQTAYDLAKESGNSLQQIAALKLICENSYYLNELDAVLNSAAEGVKLSFDSNQQPEAAYFYNLSGAASDDKEEYENALRSYFAALSINREIKNREREAKNLYNIGLTYRVTGRFDLALQYLWESVKLKEALKDLPAVANSYNSLGNVYLQTKIHPKAEETFKKALNIYTAVKDSAGLADVCGNLGLLYMQTDSLDKAEKFYLQAAEIDNRQQNLSGVASTASNLGLLYLKQGQTEAAEQAFLRSLTAEKSLDHTNGQAQVLINLSRLYMSAGRLGEAEKQAMQAISLSNKADLLTAQNVYCTAGMLYLLKGNYKLGKEMLDKYDTMKDSLFSGRLAKEMAVLRVKYENAEQDKQQFSVIRDKEINRLEKQIFRYRLLLFGLVFTAASVAGVWTIIKIRQKRMDNTNA